MKVKKKSRNLVCWLKRLLLLGAVACPLFAYFVLLPLWQIHNPNWLQKANAKEKLDTLHRVLSIPLGPLHHDAFLLANDIGTKKTIPYLISALRWQSDNGPDDDIMVCTKTHCLDALKKLTKHDAGLNYINWRKWQQTQSVSLCSDQ